MMPAVGINDGFMAGNCQWSHLQESSEILTIRKLSLGLLSLLNLTFERQTGRCNENKL